MRTIYCTVTNELVYDQRMQRICSTLQASGYKVWLIGRSFPGCAPLDVKPYQQYRLPCLFRKGKLFYVEFNLRLLIFLLFRKTDLICAIDLDTILPVYLASVFKKVPRVYDAHEQFTEMKEVASRPHIHAAWLWLEKIMVPKFRYGYTVSHGIAEYFRTTYGVVYTLIRNFPNPRPWPGSASNNRVIIYQGAVNEGRCFEQLIPAMKSVNGELHIYGDGNFLDQARQLAISNQVSHKVIFKGKRSPEELSRIAPAARIGITLFDGHSSSNYNSLANRFFDYIQAGLPQLCSAYPEYQGLNNEYPVACLLNDHSPESISGALNNLLENEVLYAAMRNACFEASRHWNWDRESAVLKEFYKKID